jgi:predicted lysophospholipase L1 biosynthesis ABC-type transport system permease subunit
MLLQAGTDTVAGYGESVAYAVGALFVLATVAYRLVTRGAGREGDKRSHEQAVSRTLDRGSVGRN